ncbi:MAG: hypothetical protein HY042_05015, partial [Spirochaetia bacterium]|nr:hypothetical protein [Spirochaetia bacterium]
ESTSTSGSSGSSGSGSTTTTTTYNIKSNYYFADNLAYQGQQMVLRYVYSQTRHSYSLSIANTATTTCQTSDGISCDSVGTKTCVTSDSVTCGGANAFIFSIRNPAMTFTGSVGTIDYSQGFSLTTDNSAVNNATLDINMSAADGTLFVGKVTCVSDPS